MIITGEEVQSYHSTGGYSCTDHFDEVEKIWSDHVIEAKMGEKNISDDWKPTPSIRVVEGSPDYATGDGSFNQISPYHSTTSKPGKGAKIWADHSSNLDW